MSELETALNFIDFNVRDEYTWQLFGTRPTQRSLSMLNGYYYNVTSKQVSIRTFIKRSKSNSHYRCRDPQQNRCIFSNHQNSETVGKFGMAYRINVKNVYL